MNTPQEKRKWHVLLWAGILFTLIIIRILDYYTPKPTYARLFVTLGEEQEKKKDYSKAIMFYKKAITQDPSYHLAYFDLANLYGNLGDQQSELEYSWKIANLGPNLEEVNETKKTIGAKKECNYSLANYKIGKNFYERKNFKKAINYLQEAHNYCSGAEIYYYLGLTYYALGDRGNAIKQAWLLQAGKFNDYYKKLANLLKPIPPNPYLNR